MREKCRDSHEVPLAEERRQEVESGSRVAASREAREVSPVIRTVTRGDATYTMDVSRIGKRSVAPSSPAKARMKEAEPEAESAPPAPVPPSFAEVRVEDAKPEAEAPPPSPFEAAIVLSSGDRLLVSAACDPRWLGDVLRALRSGPC